MVKVGGLTLVAVACVVVLASAVKEGTIWPGRPAALLLASLATYAVVGGLSLASESPAAADLPEHLLRPAAYFGLLLATVLGGRCLIRRRGVDFLLQGVLKALIASCAIVVATPLLRHWGAAWPSRLAFRMSGAFADPNEAGFAGCITVVVALALLKSSRRRNLALWGATLGVAAALASLSTTACIVLAAIWLHHLASSGLRPATVVLRWAPAATVLALLVYAVRDVRNTKSYIEYSVSPGPAAYCHELSTSNPGLRRDCTVLQEAAHVLTGEASEGRARLNWTDSRPLARWHGVRISGNPARVVSLDLSHMALSGRIPVELGRLDRLSALRLNRNLLSGPIPPELGALGRLRLLNLGKNTLTGSIPPELGALGELRVLSVHDNRLSGPGPWTLANFERLAEVRANGNDWSGGDRSVDLVQPGDLERRVRLWRLGVHRFLESPWYGAGLGGMYSLAGARDAPGTAMPTSVHNTFLKLAGEAGIVPVALYVLFLLALARTHRVAPPSPRRAASVGGALALTLYSLAFGHLLQVGAYVFAAGVLAALAGSGNPPVSTWAGQSWLRIPRAASCPEEVARS